MLNFFKPETLSNDLQALRGVIIVLLMTAAMGAGAIVLGKVLESIF